MITSAMLELCDTLVAVFDTYGICKVANSWLGLYRRCEDAVIFPLSPKVLALPSKKENRPGLIDPHAYYLSKT